MMDISEPSGSTKVKEITPSYQMMLWKTLNMQRVVQMVQRVAQKSCRRACQLFCCPIDKALCEQVTCCLPTENKTTQVALLNPPSTILIVNISNSTLIDCVIGNDSYPAAVAESQPLMQESELHTHGRCSCSNGQQGAAQISTPLPPTPPPPPPVACPSAEPLSINIHSSKLNCVIIGDNNFMHAEQVLPGETEEV